MARNLSGEGCPHVGQALRDLVQRGPREEQEAEEPQQDEQDGGRPRRDRGGQRVGGEEAEDATGVAHRTGAVGRLRDVLGDVGQPGGGEEAHDRAEPQAGVGCGVALGAEQTHAEEEQDDGQGVGHPTEGAGEDGVHDVTEGARQAPPLAHGHDERQREGEEAPPVAAVLRLDLAGAVADPPHSRAGRVGDAHPGLVHRGQWQGQAAP